MARPKKKRGKTIRVSGVRNAIEILAHVNTEAREAQHLAIRVAGSSARKATVARFAGHTGTSANVWARRVGSFRGKASKKTLASRRVWAGLKRRPTAAEDPSVAAAVSNLPDLFWATMKSGHRGLFRRRFKTVPYGKGARKHPKERRALPIDEASIDVSGIAESTLKKAGRDAMTKVYPGILSKDFKRRVIRRIKRTARITKTRG